MTDSSRQKSGSSPRKNQLCTQVFETSRASGIQSVMICSELILNTAREVFDDAEPKQPTSQLVGRPTPTSSAKELFDLIGVID